MLEEDFNLPTVFIDGSYRAGSQDKVVRQENQDLSCLRVLYFDPSQWKGHFSIALGPRSSICSSLST